MYNKSQVKSHGWSQDSRSPFLFWVHSGYPFRRSAGIPPRVLSTRVDYFLHARGSSSRFVTAAPVRPPSESRAQKISAR